MNNQDKYTGRILNFLELIEDYEIQIPIIQRDYAQGRKNQKEVRDNFLNALYECLSEEKPIKLDFVYGSIVDRKFQPLDGQQRLTTLFLLHWYAASRSKTKDTEIIHKLEKFTYETRISSREFCHVLVRESILIEDAEQKLSDMIIDKNWFFLSWKSDPTIDSMLRSIDAIHEKFFKIEDLWQKLNSALIQFYFVELENMGLTDDLYIKMNARGKLLTPFENFKAGFQKRIDEENWEQGINIEESFGVKIDNDWTDFFWEFFKRGHSIDKAQIRFIGAIAMIMQSVERSNSTDDRIGLINQLQEDPSKVRPGHFSQNSFEFLVSILNIYHERLFLYNYLDTSLPFPLWRHDPKGSFLSMVVYEENSASTIQRDSATYTQKVLFFAEFIYFLNSKELDIERQNFEEWMRVVRNIISRGDVDKDGSRPDIVRSPQSFDGAINLINELSEGCLDIYEFLAGKHSLKSQYAKDQIAEEINKAKLIKFNPSNKKIIFHAEDNELLRGKVSFLFHCIDYDFNPENFNVELFNSLATVINKYFDNERSVNNDIRRAMLTLEVNGQYEFYSYWWSYWHIGKSTKRRLFDRFREIEYCINHEHYRDYFKKFIKLLQEKSLLQIASDFEPPVQFPNWKLRLIKETELLDENNKTNHIAIAEDGTHCYLLKSKRPREIDGNLKIT